MRILHVSDVHVDVPSVRLPPRDLLGKRLLGALNLELHRRPRFAEAKKKLEGVARLCEREAIDLVIATGDFTALGTLPELEAARAAVEPLTRVGQGLVVMPGNHDVYVPDAVRERRFERHFGDLLRTDLPALATTSGYPLVRLFGAELAVVVVQSARPNPEPWRSSGHVPELELEALARVVHDPCLAGRFVVVATHYGLRRSDGSRDTVHHGLDNADELVARLAPLRFGAFLHGHLHWRFHLDVPGLALPVLCAGSTTYRGREGLWVLEVEGGHARAFPGRWDGEGYVLEPLARSWSAPS